MGLNSIKDAWRATQRGLITQVVDIDTLRENVKVLVKNYNCNILPKSKENENLAYFQELGYNINQYPSPTP